MTTQPHSYRLLPAGVVEVTLDVDPAEPAGAVRLAGDGRRVPWFRSVDGRALVRLRAGSGGEVVVTDEVSGRRLARVDVPAEEVAASRRGAADHLLARRGEAVLRNGDGDVVPWLADTWWFAFSDRISESELDEFATRRRREGFTVIQLCAGLYPEVDETARLAGTDSHHSWTDGGRAIDPVWWDAADRRMEILVRRGLTPAVVGAWSYYLHTAGPDRLRTHWREILARWGAYPGVWVVAGEMGLPGYDVVGTPSEAEHVAATVAGWREIVHYVRDTAPYDQPVTVHPCPAFGHLSSTDVLGDRELLDLVWLQTGHADRASVPPTVAALTRELAIEPTLPVINSEVCYEGIAGGSNATLQRFLAYTHLLRGAAGHSYGAHGLWAFRIASDDGPGGIWGDTDWRAAAALPGAAQTGIGLRTVVAAGWPEVRFDPGLVRIHGDASGPFAPVAARGPDSVIVYFPSCSLLDHGIGISTAYRHVELAGLEPGRWRIELVDPRTGAATSQYEAEVSADGRCPLPAGNFSSCLPTFEDWVLVARR